ncbi:MAG: hypothetical protein HOO67_01000 [Candidatus Peribacteraceae bacterium]|nr:hypothetical protein [Candidatus Peribacteraceae bacterium]
MMEPSPPLLSLGSRCIAVIGMNGAGKTVFGKRLAAKIGWKRADTDRVVKEKHGDHHEFIGEHGWEKFRTEEERIVLDSLKPGYVVILSGGAIESPIVRSTLKDRAVVLWLQADHRRIHRHLTKAKVSRPEFADGLHPSKVKDMLETRDPLYKAAANIVLPASVPFARQVPVAMIELQKYGRTLDPRR